MNKKTVDDFVKALKASSNETKLIMSAVLSTTDDYIEEEDLMTNIATWYTALNNPTKIKRKLEDFFRL